MTKISQKYVEEAKDDLNFEVSSLRNDPRGYIEGEYDISLKGIPNSFLEKVAKETRLSTRDVASVAEKFRKWAKDHPTDYKGYVEGEESLSGEILDYVLNDIMLPRLEQAWDKANKKSPKKYKNRIG